MLPSYHTFYWMGLNTSSWPDFTWIDDSPAPDYNSSYTHWGLSPSPEPNNRPNPPENCAGANISTAFSSLANGSHAAWGWADANCSLGFNFMCKIMRKTSMLPWRVPDARAVHTNPASLV